MHRLLILLAALLAALAPPAQSYAQTEGVTVPKVPTLSVTLTPADTAERGGYLMGQIVLNARIVSRHAFEALSLDLPEIDDGDVRTLMRPRTRKVRSYGGDGYVFETSIVIFPTKSGTLIIPPVRASGRVTSDTGEDIAFDHETPPRQIAIAGIPDDYGDPWWLVSPQISMTETWSTPLDQVHDGQILTRTVTIKAHGVSGEQIPTLDHRQTRGTTVQPAKQTHATTTTPDGVIGVSEQSWTIKINQGGAVYLSPVSLAFWNLGIDARQKVSVPGHRIEPLAPDGESITASLLAEAAVARRGHRLLFVVLLGLLAAPFVAGIATLGILCLPSATDMRLIGGIRAARDPVEMYRAVVAWNGGHGSAVSAGKIDIAAGGSQMHRLRNTLFSKAPHSVSAAGLLRELLGASRRQRLRRFMHRAQTGFRLLVAGPVQSRGIGLGARR